MDEILMPGDELAASEEYISGPGTYEADGKIYAAIIGERDFDEAEKIARVRASNPPVTLKIGDIVLGEVNNVTNSIASVIVSAMDGNGRSIGQNSKGVVHVSKIKDGYVQDARREFHVGDLLRARVEQVEPSLQIATNAEELGVLKARCDRCRGMLSNRDGGLFCPICKREESRKLAGDFHRYTPYFQESVRG